MPSAFPSLRQAAIHAGLSVAAAEALRNLTVLEEVGSTNAWLLQLSRDEFHAHAVFADQQTAGRGRRGRAWQSPPGSNIYLSLGWIFQFAARDLYCLPLVVGISVVRALESIGIAGVGLKWPNDILADGCKLAGILLESRPASGGRAAVVIGIGINVAMPPEDAAAQAIDQPWTSVAGLPNVKAEENLRERLAGAVLDCLLQGLVDYEAHGFAPFIRDWQRLDLLCNRTVRVTAADGEVHGVASGIDEQGNLLVAEQLPAGEQQMHRFSSGEVSVRMDDPR